MSNRTQKPGEGNREADRDYRENTREFVKSGKVGEKAREAEPDSDAEATEMREAERAGRARAKVDGDDRRVDSH